MGTRRSSAPQLSVQVWLSLIGCRVWCRRLVDKTQSCEDCNTGSTPVGAEEFSEETQKRRFFCFFKKFVYTGMVYSKKIVVSRFNCFFFEKIMVHSAINSNTFLAYFNHIDKFFEVVLGLDGYMPFTEKVDKISEGRYPITALPGNINTNSNILVISEIKSFMDFVSSNTIISLRLTMRSHR